MAQPEKQIKDKKLHAPSGKGRKEHTALVIVIQSRHLNEKMRMGEEEIFIIEFGSTCSNHGKTTVVDLSLESNFVVSTIKNSEGVKCL